MYSTVMGSSVGEYLNGRLWFSLTVKLLAMKAVTELSVFLVIGEYRRVIWLEYGWLHSKRLKSDYWPNMGQLVIAAVELSGGYLRTWEIR